MDTVDVGILRAPSINFVLTGDFFLEGDAVSGENSVIFEDGRLRFNGRMYDTLRFKASAQDSSFTLRDVVIGVGFHWQRLEDQTFKGDLHFIVEDGQAS